MKRVASCWRYINRIQFTTVQKEGLANQMVNMYLFSNFYVFFTSNQSFPLHFGYFVRKKKYYKISNMQLFLFLFCIFGEKKTKQKKICKLYLEVSLERIPKWTKPVNVKQNSLWTVNKFCLKSSCTVTPRESSTYKPDCNTGSSSHRQES